MTNEIKRKRRPRYEISCSEEDLKMVNELSKLEGKKRNKVIIELVKKRLEELKEENKWELI